MNEFSTYSSQIKSALIGLNECFAPVIRTYERGEVITICSSENDIIGIVLNGVAYLSINNTEEQRRILDCYQEGDAFGLHLIPEHENKAFCIIAKTKCTVSFVPYKKFVNCCEKHCEKHVKILDSFIMSSIKRNIMHADIMAQRTLRSKLMSYFEYIKTESGRDTFTLPLPLTDLADYLAVDRTAMMREIRKLNDEQIIRSEKQTVTLL